MPFYDNRKKPDRRQKLERDWQDDRRAGRAETVAVLVVFQLP